MQLALQGAVMQMVAHGFSTAALFMIAGSLQERLHTRDMREMGGLWQNMPRMGAVAMFFVVASLGLPGLGNFVAEFLVLLGLFQVDRWLTVIAALGLITGAAYSLLLMQRSFQGEPDETRQLNRFWQQRDAHHGGDDDCIDRARALPAAGIGYCPPVVEGLLNFSATVTGELL